MWRYCNIFLHTMLLPTEEMCSRLRLQGHRQMLFRQLHPINCLSSRPASSERWEAALSFFFGFEKITVPLSSAFYIARLVFFLFFHGLLTIIMTDVYLFIYWYLCIFIYLYVTLCQWYLWVKSRYHNYIPRFYRSPWKHFFSY